MSSEASGTVECFECGGYWVCGPGHTFADLGAARRWMREHRAICRGPVVLRRNPEVSDE